MSNSLPHKILVKISKTIQDAKALIITAGAGMGVDSGLPDFRGSEGFHRAYPPISKLGLTFPDVSTPRWFKEDPEFAWGFFGHRLGLYRGKNPHPGYSILLRWAENRPDGYFVFTSNVDGHFQKASFPEERIMECHGNINYMQCANPLRCSGERKSAIWHAEDLNVAVDEKTFRAKPPLPKCKHCGGLARPNVLMFSDFLWEADRTDAQEERYHTFISALMKSGKPYVVIEIGAGETVPTVRLTSEALADPATSGKRGTLIRINPRDFLISLGGEHHQVPMYALAALNSIAGYVDGVEVAHKGTDVGSMCDDEWVEEFDTEPPADKSAIAKALEDEARALKDDIL